MPSESEYRYDTDVVQCDNRRGARLVHHLVSRRGMYKQQVAERSDGGATEIEESNVSLQPTFSRAEHYDATLFFTDDQRSSIAAL